MEALETSRFGAQVWAKLRALHGCPPLELDRELAQKAQEHAERMAVKNQMHHCLSPNHGENLSMRDGTKPTTITAFTQSSMRSNDLVKQLDHVNEGNPPTSSIMAASAATSDSYRIPHIMRLTFGNTKSHTETGQQATLRWYSEVVRFNYGEEQQSMSGNFSQIVWKSTTHAGFGRKSTNGGCNIFIAGYYKPSGNVTGRFAQNVPRPISGTDYVPTQEEMGW
ncbi:unnamed protein product [Echinostoma caproni]|uniref:SCP domain-containing protein n=1 Tax=Echinostoma caproni TaxID=27848 RepID=A0A183ACP2_9TREM|nr:unnamed protein product [Echinostoma caproni]